MVAKATSRTPIIQVKEATNEEYGDKKEAKNAKRRLKRVQSLELLEEIQVGHCVSRSSRRCGGVAGHCFLRKKKFTWGYRVYC
jgi:hypothetical protein